MLWFRFWLETRLRVTFLFAWSLFFFLLGVYPVATRAGAASEQIVRAFVAQTTFIAIFGAGFLAGTDVRTQVFGGRPGRGVHGSVQFTLSLPVSRARLLITRAAVAIAESITVVVLLSLITWLLFEPLRANVAPSRVVLHAAFVALACLGIHGLALLTSTVFDDMVQMWVVMGVAIVPFALRAQLPPFLDFMDALMRGSPLVTDAVPWNIAGIAVVAGSLFVLAAIRVVQMQEY